MESGKARMKPVTALQLWCQYRLMIDIHVIHACHLYTFIYFLLALFTQKTKSNAIPVTMSIPSILFLVSK